MLNKTQLLQQYGIAIASVMVALLLMLALDPFLQLTQASFLLFFGAVTITALYGGRTAGIVATILSSIFANYFFLDPQYTWALSLAGALRLNLFILQGILISILIGTLRATQAQSRQNLNWLKASEAEIKNLNQALQRRVDELQTLFNVIPINIVVAEDPECRVVRANPAYSERLQIPPDINVSVAVPDRQAHLPYRFYQNGQEITGDALPVEYAAKHGVEVRDIEIDLVQQDNTVINLYGHAVPLFDEMGQSRGSIGVFTDITDLKKAETALRDSEEQLKIANERFLLAAKAVNCLIYDWDMTCDRVERTDGLTRLLGYSLDEAEPTAKWWADRIHPDDLQAAQNHAWSVLATEDTCSVEYRVRNKANQYVDMLDQCLVAARDVEGRPIRIVGSTIDISDRKRAAAELQQRELEFRTLVENTPDIITRYDRDLRHLYISSTIEQTIGVPVEQIIGKTVSELGLKYPQLQDWYATIQHVFATGERCLLETEFPKSDGESRLYQVHFVPELWEGDQVKTVVSFARDITEYKRAQESLRQSEERLRLAMEAAQLGTWDVNLTTGKAIWSEQHFTLLGFEPVASGEASETIWMERIHPDDRERILQAWQQSQLNHQLYQTEYRVIRADTGEIGWVAALGSFTYDSNDQAVRSVGVVFDITQRKQAEVERQRLLERERAVREEAERANRVKDEFLSILSHELRSPLNPILGWARLLQAKQFDESTTTQALSTIERNARLQTQLIDDLLDVAKILRGKLNLNETAVHLVSVVEAAIEVVRTAAEAKTILLMPDLADIGQVWGDSARLQQIVWNLLSNAVKFTPSGGRVIVRLERVKGEEHESAAETSSNRSAANPATHRPSYAQISVIDTGKGISPQFLPHIFESFRQEDVSITRRYGGLGLGLSIVKYLVDAHGGTIIADSPGEGQGATFTIKLPLLREESVVSPGASPSASNIDLTGIKVLAVDDGEDARDLLTMLLAQYGAAAKVVASAKEVLALLGEFAPHVLVCDIGMPEMDGYMLLQRIRSLPADQGGDTPAIALTAYAKEEDSQRALAHGFQRHLAKPVEPDQLITAIAELTNHS